MAGVTRHLVTPFELDRSGAPRTVAQDSEQELRQCVTALLSTRLGSRPESPGYGITDPTFTREPDVVGITAALGQWEPRADSSAVLGDVTDAGVRRVTVGDV